MIGDNFKEISISEIPIILNILENNLTGNFLLHQYISIMAYGMTDKAQISQVLFCCGDFENGVYLIETRFKKVVDLRFFFVYSLAKDLKILKKALSDTNVIPWMSTLERFVFEVTASQFTQTICQVFIEKKLKVFVQHYISMWLPPDVKVHAKGIPETLCLENLNETHAEEIDKHWPSFKNQREVLKNEISSLFGLGIFRKSDKKLLSYAICFHSGGIFMLHSDACVRRKGLGDIVTRNVIFEVRQRGWTPFCTVFPDNYPSINLFKKIGFIEYGKADFIFPLQFINDTA